MDLVVHAVFKTVQAPARGLVGSIPTLSRHIAQRSALVVSRLQARNAAMSRSTPSYSAAGSVASEMRTCPSPCNESRFRSRDLPTARSRTRTAPPHIHRYFFRPSWQTEIAEDKRSSSK